MRPVDGLMASCRPAGAAGQESGVIAAADQDGAPSHLLLEVTLQAQGGVAFRQHFLVHRAVRLMTGIATLPQRFVLENKRSALHRVTLEAGIVDSHQVGPATFHGRAFVRIVTRAAAHLAFHDRVMMGKGELRPHVLVTLETGLRILLGIHNLANIATALHVQAAGAVTGLAPDVLPAVAGQARVGRGVKVARDGVMAYFAAVRSDKVGPGNARRSDQDASG